MKKLAAAVTPPFRAAPCADRVDPRATGARPRAHVALAALAVALSAPGCYASWDLAPRELEKLRGYSTPQRVVLHAEDGEAFCYGPEHQLAFYRAGDDALPRPVRLDAIEVDPGRVRGIERESRSPFAIDLATVKKVRAERFSPGGTAGLAVGVAMGGITVAVAGTGVVILESFKGVGIWPSSAGSDSFTRPPGRLRGR